MRISTVTSQMVAIGGSPSMTPRNTATSAMAVSTLCLSTSGRLARGAARLFAGQAVSPLARRERCQRRFQLRNVEIRPQRVAEEDLGVGEVPQQEVADPMVAAGADEEVGIGHVAQRQRLREARLVDGLDAY